MAALVAGVQYSLSSHIDFHKNKSFIFVKLTDSAQRAIEDYLRNRNNISLAPTIQFLGNDGQLFFPSANSNHGNFTFSLTGNQDIEGPQGGFECIQQTGPKDLESLGALPCKMRIHANDDVYETTRRRMHVVEENNKNKCTRVIKASDPVGRKIKIKGTVKAPPTSLTSSNSNDSIAKHQYRTFVNSPNPLSQPSDVSSSKSISNNVAVNRLQPDTHKKALDIVRRPLKERLIHLLAVKPFKKIELYDRINKEGVREREKNAIATVLKQVAFMKDNTYHLQRCVWNDVQEDWPFYTDQEKLMLKRRKPQNLTPLGSSDSSSSGSGQSPNSVLLGSSSASLVPSIESAGTKRPGYVQGNDGLPTKRQRISHYKKPESNGSLNTSDNNRSTVDVNWDQRHTQQDNQIYYQNHQEQDLHTNGYMNEKLSPPFSTGHEDSSSNSVSTNLQGSGVIKEEFSSSQGSSVIKEEFSSSQNSYNGNSLLDCNGRENPYMPGSPDSCNRFESISSEPCNRFEPISSEPCNETNNMDYLTSYTTIRNTAQRSRYKAEFAAYYKEYSKLHAQVVNIAQVFRCLEDEFRKKTQSGNKEGCEAIQQQILQEYSKSKSVKSQYSYLHNKLSHIKQLVSDYDAQNRFDSASNDRDSLRSGRDPGDSSFYKNKKIRNALIDFHDQASTRASEASHLS